MEFALLSVCVNANRLPLTIVKLPPVPSVLRGSLICLRRKCGKPNCHCREGQAHASPALSFSQRSKTKILTLPRALVPQVRAAITRYLQNQKRLERQANAGLRQLARRLRQTRKSSL
jgi:hypothetical protein